ncbi:MAG: OsmC family protein [Saprospiraceae bacterium]|nr:OsmC family protein [Saprospiraceae bacterium]
MSTEKTYKTLSVEMTRVDDAFHFEAVGGDKIVTHIDAAAAIGGSNSGTRPMELILMGLGSCAAIDAILILKKMKQEVTDFRIVVEGKRDANATPAPFEAIEVRFILRGTNLSEKKVNQAVQLGMEKYCSVGAMLEKSAAITWKAEIENEK